MKGLLFLLFLCISTSFLGQEGFVLENGKIRARLPFKLVNNLPVVEIKINGTPLSFILDTGVRSSILFSLEDADSLQIRNTSSVTLQGLGAGESLNAIKSLNNKVEIGGITDFKHSLFIIFDSSLNFSPRMGIPIHGILGNEFFKNFVVEIKYASKIIKVYDPTFYNLKNCRKCEDINLSFVSGKPYITLKAASDNKIEDVTLLLDSGSSDVMWLFDERDFISEVPKNYFRDFLGLGLSGDINGKRTRIPALYVGNFKLSNVSTSFPEAEAVKKARYYKERDGSLGGGFLKRFTVIFDYGNNLVRFKKNKNFKTPFHYNMSGLTLEHKGVELRKEEKRAVVNTGNFQQDESQRKNAISVTTEVHFSLVPKYIVVDVRKDSPADLAGIQKDDEVISINGKQSFQYKLYELVELFSSEAWKRIQMEIRRNGNTQKVKFYLKPLI